MTELDPGSGRQQPPNLDWGSGHQPPPPLDSGSGHQPPPNPDWGSGRQQPPSLDWGSDHLEPPKKRSYTAWILGCLGCFMFLVGSTLVALWFGGAKLKEFVTAKLEEFSDPEVQWPALGAWLPFDEQPEGFEIVKWPMQDLWQLEAVRDDLVIFLMALPTEGSADAASTLVTRPETVPLIQIMQAEFAASETTLTLQGRELFGARLERKLPPKMEPGAEEGPPKPVVDPSGQGLAATYEQVKSISGDGLALDVTPEGSDTSVLLWLFRRREGGTVTDEDARAALSPFLIGPDRR